MAGEKFWNHNHKSRRQYVALEHGTPLLRVGVGISDLAFHLPPWVWVILFWPLICSLPRHRDLWSNDVKILPTSLSCRQYVQEKSTSAKKKKRLRLIVHKSHFTTLHLPVSRRWCGKHYGPPSTKTTSYRLQLIIQESGLETPFRYLGACMP